MKSIWLLPLLFPLAAASAAAAEYTLVIKDHRFQPAQLAIPAGQKIKLLIENRDATPEEFDSHALNREKVISGHGTATLYIGPLDSGSYPFSGEFHETTAQGAIIAQ